MGRVNKLLELSSAIDILDRAKINLSHFFDTCFITNTMSAYTRKAWYWIAATVESTVIP